MKSLLIIFLSISTVLASYASADRYKISTKVIYFPKDRPVKIEPGHYSDEQIKDVFRDLAKIPEIRLIAYPIMINKLDAVASLETEKSKLINIRLSKKDEPLHINGEFHDIASKVIIPLDDQVKINDTIIKVDGNIVVVVTVEKAE